MSARGVKNVRSQWNSTLINIYVVWHPNNDLGKMIFEEIFSHYYSDVFAGLPGGLIEVYARSEETVRDSSGESRPLPIPSNAPSSSNEGSIDFVIPVLDSALDMAIRESNGVWGDYLSEVCGIKGGEVREIRNRIVCPVVIDGVEVSSNVLRTLYDRYQYTVIDSVMLRHCWERKLKGDRRLEYDYVSQVGNMLCDISQVATQELLKRNGDESHIRVFVCHTKHGSDRGKPDLFNDVVDCIAKETRLGFVFDKHDFLPASDWQRILREGATANHSAILMVRTDEFSRRLWTQKEIRLAKEYDVPIVMLSALVDGDDRGSFLLDNVPIVPMRYKHSKADRNMSHPWVVGKKWGRSSIKHAIYRLADECLKKQLIRGAAKSIENGDNRGNYSTVSALLRVPEPVSLLGDSGYRDVSEPLSGLRARLAQKKAGDEGVSFVHSMLNNKRMIALYPDPPMTDQERMIIDRLGSLASKTFSRRSVDRLSDRMKTPRQIEIEPISGLDDRGLTLKGKTVGISASKPAGLTKLGLAERHVDVALMTFARYTIVNRGKILFGGKVPDDGDPHNMTRQICDEARRYGRISRDSSGAHRLADEGASSIHMVPWTVVTEERLHALYQMGNHMYPDSIFQVISPKGEIVEIGEALDTFREQRDSSAHPDSESCLTAFRKRLVMCTDIRIVLGGGFPHQNRTYEDGVKPGILEEIQLTLSESDAPVYLVGGYGGLTRYLAQRLGYLPGGNQDMYVDYGFDERSFRSADGGVAQEELEEAIRLWRNEGGEERTGLSKRELKRLARSQRPAEIMSLVLHGHWSRQRT